MRTTIPSLPSGDAVGSLDVSAFQRCNFGVVHSCRNVYIETRFFGHRFSAEDIIERLLVVLGLDISLVHASRHRGELTRKILWAFNSGIRPSIAQ